MLYALDVKTSYSMLSSLIKIDDLTEKAKTVMITKISAST